MSRARAYEARYPGQPCLWRKDWADRCVIDDRRGSAIGLSLASCLSIAIAAWGWYAAPGEGRTAIVLVSIWTVCTIALIAAAVLETLQSRRFGASICRFENTPIEPGTMFRGTIEAGGPFPAIRELKLPLSCISRVPIQRTSLREKSHIERAIWSEEQIIRRDDGRNPRISFSFSLPHDLPGTSRTRSIYWKLEATSAATDAAYDAVFQLPVFHEQTMTAAEAEALSVKLREQR